MRWNGRIALALVVVVGVLFVVLAVTARPPAALWVVEPPDYKKVRVLAFSYRVRAAPEEHYMEDCVLLDSPYDGAHLHYRRGLFGRLLYGEGSTVDPFPHVRTGEEIVGDDGTTWHKWRRGE